MIRPWPIAYAAALILLASTLVVGLNPITAALLGVSLGAGAAGILTDRSRS